PYRVASAENRVGLFRRSMVGNEHGRGRVRGHELGVPALRLRPCADGVGAKHRPAAQAPFATAIGGLDPGHADAVAYLSGNDAGAELDNLSYWLVTQDPRKRAGQAALGLVDIRKADSAGMNPDQPLIGARHRPGQLLKHPAGVDSGGDSSAHTSSYAGKVGPKKGAADSIRRPYPSQGTDQNTQRKIKGG